ncbi:MAG: hypothetical protein CMJ18_07865 [Phycisphaeraceae bacterium]|nr:hypothetical protein [Phycisphaeraceae bacterium]
MSELNAKTFSCVVFAAVMLTVTIAVAWSRPVHRAYGAPRRTGFVIDVNRAGAGDLCLLPGIGPTLAARMIRHRDAHGPFERLDDLGSIAGIGSRTLQRIEPLVAPFDPPTARPDTMLR